MWKHKVHEISRDNPFLRLIYSELVISFPALSTLDKPTLCNVYSVLKEGNLGIGQHIRRSLISTVQ